MMLPPFPYKGGVRVNIVLTKGLNEGGQPNVHSQWQGLCIFDESARTSRGGDKSGVTLSGLMMIDGDIAPDLEKIEGSVSLSDGGGNYKIHYSRRLRSIGGQVHHTELELV